MSRSSTSAPARGIVDCVEIVASIEAGGSRPWPCAGTDSQTMRARTRGIRERTGRSSRVGLLVKKLPQTGVYTKGRIERTLDELIERRPVKVQPRAKIGVRGKPIQSFPPYRVRTRQIVDFPIAVSERHIHARVRA